jgi:hypothetical protein
VTLALQRPATSGWPLEAPERNPWPAPKPADCVQTLSSFAQLKAGGTAKTTKGNGPGTDGRTSLALQFSGVRHPFQLLDTCAGRKGCLPCEKHSPHHDAFPDQPSELPAAIARRVHCPDRARGDGGAECHQAVANRSVLATPHSAEVQRQAGAILTGPGARDPGKMGGGGRLAPISN